MRVKAVDVFEGVGLMTIGAGICGLDSEGLGWLLSFGVVIAGAFILFLCLVYIVMVKEEREKRDKRIQKRRRVDRKKREEAEKEELAS